MSNISSMVLRSFALANVLTELLSLSAMFSIAQSSSKVYVTIYFLSGKKFKNDVAFEYSNCYED